MLPRKQLVPLKQEFDSIRQTGRRFDSPSFGLLIQFGEKDNPAPQFAFVVSKKVDRRSVVRHEVKRKLAEAAGKLTGRLSPTVKIVFLAKAAAIKQTKEGLATELVTILKRAQILQ